MPPFKPVSETDLRVLMILDGVAPRSQRDIARAAGLSVGTANVAIRRLLEAGLLHVDSGNSRKRRYLLTQLGRLERRQTTMDAVAKAVKNFGLIKKTVQAEVLRARAGGASSFWLVGDNALAEAADAVLSELSSQGLTYERALRLEEVPASAQAMLLTTDDAERAPRGTLAVELHTAIQGTELLR